MQGFLLILESCNNVIVEHWVKSLAELLNVLKKKKSVLSKQCQVAAKIRSRSTGNLRGLPREPIFSLSCFV